MATSVKPITLWRRSLEDRPGTLAESLSPLADARGSVSVVMAYRIPGEPGRGVVEVFPVSGKRTTAAVQGAGFSASSIPALLVEGDDSPGLGRAQARAIADAGINLDFLVAQVIGRKFSAVYGFASADDARRAVPLIKKAGAPVRRAATRSKKR
jgi:hypothetical protein